MDFIEKNELIVVMGALKFKPHELDEVTIVAFTFLLVNVDDSLKIKAHHSSPVTWIIIWYNEICVIVANALVVQNQNKYLKLFFH